MLLREFVSLITKIENHLEEGSNAEVLINGKPIAEIYAEQKISKNWFDGSSVITIEAPRIIESLHINS